ncbi:MAG: gliding motility protein GldL [Muribaculaceae bacterium]|nr:gliding motility protein GldL [Muribaculaceae bacterium]MDE6346145.1 gliding motility protein GldL [Muribaculaceae bacterium]
MGKVKRYKNRITRFLQSDGGQRFFNFAYSIGAAIVIWGALFKILHLPGGNFLLSLGMGTEVLMFVLSAFDRPPREYHWEEVFPSLDPDHNKEGHDGEASGIAAQGALPGTTVIVTGSGTPAASSGRNVSVAEAKAAAGIPGNINLTEEDSRSLSESIAKMAAASDQLARMAELTTATQRYLDQMASIASEMEHLRTTTAALNEVSDVLLDSYRAITENSENITRSSTGYVEQMQDLNRNLTGLNTIYEIQLKSVSSQLDSIDRVNRGIKDIRDMYEKSSTQSARYVEETERMAHYMHQLNAVYEKMLTAMTVNMYRQPIAVDTPPVNGNGAQV